tara:strand:+ start:334 stop:591 length:258 start_codon:yes stop_codon:yes gene_type:complete
MNEFRGKIRNFFRVIKRPFFKKKDFYESIKIGLDTFYLRLFKRSVIIIDDYRDFPGCRKALDNYFLNKNVFMIGVDKSCRVIIKD